MITKYRVRFEKIEKIEIIRETEKFVFIKSSISAEMREAKVSSWNVYFDSFDAAKNFLVESLSKSVESLERNLEREKAKLGKTLNIEPF